MQSWQDFQRQHRRKEIVEDIKSYIGIAVLLVTLWVMSWLLAGFAYSI